MTYSFNEIILVFFIYSVVGWLWETFYCSLKDRHFDYRGFLLGPYCPIYGFGVGSVLLLLRPFEQNILLLYVTSAVLVSVLEYITSYLLELFFHTSWWNYDDVPLNINGRVAIPVSLFWGLGCVVIVKWVQPEVMKMVHWVISETGVVTSTIIVIVMVADTVYTVINMKQFQAKVAQWDKEMDSFWAKAQAENAARQKAGLKTLTELKAISEDHTLTWQQRFVKQSDIIQAHPFDFNQRRIMRSFRNLRVRREQHFDELKKVVKRH